MKSVNTSFFSNDECWGIQINGTSHCTTISCKWLGLTACEGLNIIKTGYNSIGYKVGKYGVEEKVPVK